MKDADTIDWALLRDVRSGFLEAGEAPAGRTALADYWRSDAHLEAYDRTFAERIRWKWDAVLAELVARSVSLPEDAIIHDFGTGTGVAVRALLSALVTTPAHADRLRVRLADRSTRALAFAERRLREEHPRLKIERWDPAAAALPPRSVLLASHVVTELDQGGLDCLIQLAGAAALTIWVEPGIPSASRALIAARETLRATCTVLAPCGHNAVCGLTDAANAKHWCHHFAKPPSEASQSPLWARFRRELGIDLRSLPTSFLVLGQTKMGNGPVRARVIGRPRIYKGFAKVLVCDAEGVRESDLRKRMAKADPDGLWERLEDSAFTNFLPVPT